LVVLVVVGIVVAFAAILAMVVFGRGVGDPCPPHFC
jgi:hypothetical protein